MEVVKGAQLHHPIQENGPGFEIEGGMLVQIEREYRALLLSLFQLLDVGEFVGCDAGLFTYYYY